MAIQKALLDPWSVEHPAAYFKIPDPAFNYSLKQVRFSVLVYHSKAVRDAGGNPLPLTQTVTVDGDDFLTYFDDSKFTGGVTPRQLCYDYLLNSPGFAGAASV